MASAKATSPSPAPITFIGAVKDAWSMYSDNAQDYALGPPIGFGASSVVHQAIFHSRTKPNGPVTDIPCALKVLDLDKLPPSSLKLLTRETQLMSLSKHPNVLRVRGSWMLGHKLYIAMRLMNKGSVADVMKYAFIDGIEEEAIKCILEQALQGLNYLHINGFIHRDIKGANFLIDEDGTVLLGDLGVAVSLCDEEDVGANRVMGAVRQGYGSNGPVFFGAAAGASASASASPAAKKEKDLRRGKRKSFVGTPCWMAPEVISQQHYDSSADIWSLGITALELCCGRAPGSREKDLKRVLLSTLNNEPPTLDREGGKYKYSKALKEMIESCLVKDPSKRPSAAQLLQHSFFRGTKRKSYLVNALLSNLPPLSERQERRLLSQQPGTGGKYKPLAIGLGSTSMASLATSHSWDWNWTIAGSPRSTIKRDGSTPPGSMRANSPSVNGADVYHASPESSVASLHNPAERHHPYHSASGSHGHPHSHSSLHSHPHLHSASHSHSSSHPHPYGHSTGLNRSSSLARHSQHLHGPGHTRVSSVSEHMPHLDMSVFEMDGEAMASSLQTADRVRDESLLHEEAHEEPQRGRRRKSDTSTHPSSAEPSSLNVDKAPISSSPTELLLQPPDLSSASQSTSSEAPSAPGTPPSGLGTALLVGSFSPSSSPNPYLGHNELTMQAPPAVAPQGSKPSTPPKPKRNVGAKDARSGVPVPPVNSSIATQGESMAPSKSKTGGLWKKMKAAKSSASGMIRPSTSSGVRTDRDKKGGFGTLVERTMSRASRA